MKNKHIELQQAVIKKGNQFFCKKRTAKQVKNLQSFDIHWHIGSMLIYVLKLAYILT